jgi:hypothetical protein
VDQQPSRAEDKYTLIPIVPQEAPKLEEPEDKKKCTSIFFFGFQFWSFFFRVKEVFRRARALFFFFNILFLTRV